MTNALQKNYNFIINNGTKNCPTEFEIKRTRIVNLFVLLSSFLVLFFTVMNIVLGFPILVFLDLFIIVLIAISFTFNYFNNWTVGKIILLYAIPAYLTVFPAFFGNIGTEYYNFVLLIFGFYIIDKKQHLVSYTLFITILFSLSKYLINTVNYPDGYAILETVHYYPCVVSSALMVAGLISLFKIDTENYQKKLINNQKELDAKIIELVKKDELNRSLLKELNHRVKNNLQMISGLFTLQMYNYNNHEIREALREAQQRIDAITILHQHLYKYDSSLKPNLRNYILQLIDYLTKAGTDNDNIIIDHEIDNVSYTIEKAMHIGLLINELITNSLKYGLNKENGKYELVVKLKTNSLNSLNIRVADKGPGFPNSFSLNNHQSFGMELVETIAQKYSGAINIDNKKGAIIDIELKNMN